MKKEKHKWVKKKDYINTLGDLKYHHIIEYYVCEICGARKI